MRRLARRCRACFWAGTLLVYLPFKLGWYVFLYFVYQDGPESELIHPVGRTEV